jgi:hypothetical protein
MNLTGKIISTFSEATNGAPVVVTVETGTETESVAFERRLWNDFFHAHQDRIQAPDFQVLIEGEPWEASMRCLDDCVSCNPDE